MIIFHRECKIYGEELCSKVYEYRRKLRNAWKKFKLELESEKIKDFQINV